MSSDKLLIGFYAGGLPFNGDTLNHSSLGGSETALYYMAKNLAALGHDVKIFNNCPEPGKFDKVDYFDYSRSWKDVAPVVDWDTFIISRDFTFCSHNVHSRLTGLWNHDVLRESKPIMTNIWGADFMWCLSKFHEEQFLSVAKELAPMMHRTRNGLDFDFINNLKKEHDATGTKDKSIYVWGSRWERGIDILLEKTWPKILKEVNPDAQLLIAGYSHQGIQLPEEITTFYKYVETLIKDTPRVTNLGSLTKRDWYKLLFSSGFMIYPTTFPEISCINAMEAQACRIPIITSNEFALKETIKDKNNLISGHPRSDEYQNRFVARVARLSKSEFDYKQTTSIGYDHVFGYYDWKIIAKEWETFFWDQFTIRSKQKGGKSIIRRQIYNSDLLAAKWALDHPHETGIDLEACIDLKSEINTYLVNQHVDPEDYIKGAGIEASSKHYEFGLHKTIGRFQVVNAHIKKAVGDKKFTLLDVGCGTGYFMSSVLDEFKNKASVLGIDFSAGIIDAAREYITRHFKNLADTDFLIQGDFMDDSFNFSEENGLIKADIVFAGEWLEHQQDLYKALNKLEQATVEGGTVIITVPSGPWEAMSYRREHGRMHHVSHFEFRDIEELFFNKEFFMEYFPVGISDIDHSLLGNWIISWKADQSKPFGQINYLRKFKTARPYQFISACLITRNEEDNIARCLKSIKQVVDEIIVADTGSKDDTVAIAKKYADKVVEFPWPEDFSEARNKSMSYTDPDADWIYWMDCDEILVQSDRLRTYLNNTLFNGFVITQNHLTLDVQNVKPDVPVRIFRNNIGISFFGAIHEHCEFALDKPIDPILILPDVKIVHFGYLTEQIRRSKCKDRNLPLLVKDREKYPQRKLGVVLMMRDYINVSQWELEATNNKITDTVIKYMREVIRLHKTYFNDEKYLHYDLSHSIYQRALQILGNAGVAVTPEGIDIPFELRFGMGGAVGGMVNPQDVGIHSMWFSAREELQEFLSTRGALLADTLQLPAVRKK